MFQNCTQIGSPIAVVASHPTLCRHYSFLATPSLSIPTVSLVDALTGAPTANNTVASLSCVAASTAEAALTVVHTGGVTAAQRLIVQVDGVHVSGSPHDVVLAHGPRSIAAARRGVVHREMETADIWPRQRRDVWFFYARQLGFTLARVKLHSFHAREVEQSLHVWANLPITGSAPSLRRRLQCRALDVRFPHGRHRGSQCLRRHRCQGRPRQ